VGARIGEEEKKYGARSQRKGSANNVSFLREYYLKEAKKKTADAERKRAKIHAEIYWAFLLPDAKGSDDRAWEKAQARTGFRREQPSGGRSSPSQGRPERENE